MNHSVVMMACVHQRACVSMGHVFASMVSLETNANVRKPFPAFTPAFKEKIIFADIECDLDCYGNGRCDFTQGVCECFEGFTGYTCEIESKPCPVQDCNGNGGCDPLTGICFCDSPFFGEACECKPESSSVDQWFIQVFSLGQQYPHGNCSVITELCNCELGYTGFQCKDPVPDKVCSERGIYNALTEKCDCFEGFVGADCSCKIF